MDRHPSVKVAFFHAAVAPLEVTHSTPPTFPLILFSRVWKETFGKKKTPKKKNELLLLLPKTGNSKHADNGIEMEKNGAAAGLLSCFFLLVVDRECFLYSASASLSPLIGGIVAAFGRGQGRKQL